MQQEQIDKMTYSYKLKKIEGHPYSNFWQRSLHWLCCQINKIKKNYEVF